MEYFAEKVESSQNQRTLEEAITEYRKTIEDLELFLSHFRNEIKKLEGYLKELGWKKTLLEEHMVKDEKV